MSDVRGIRRADKLMADEATIDLLKRGFSGRLATVGADGYPYCVPLLHVWMEGGIWVHNTAAKGHLRGNVDHDDRVCFEVDEAGPVFNYGRFECDSSLAYESVVAFGRIRIVRDREEKRRFCDALLAKYGVPGTNRPKSFYPRLGAICVYAIAVERMTGKRTPFPSVSEQWPAADRTATPNAREPAPA